jgi:hypothetical protein
MLLLLAIISFVQNMAFTYSSRSRNSGDPRHHMKAALLSNGVWFFCHILVWSRIWKALTEGNVWILISTGVVYVIFTTWGSVVMMKRMLKSEKGKRRVGSKG